MRGRFAWSGLATPSGSSKRLVYRSSSNKPAHARSARRKPTNGIWLKCRARVAIQLDGRQISGSASSPVRKMIQRNSTIGPLEFVFAGVFVTLSIIVFKS